MTRFARRAAIIAAALLAAPLAFTLVATTGAQALAAGAPVAVGAVSTVESAGAVLADNIGDYTTEAAKAKKKKKKPAKKKPAATPAKRVEGASVDLENQVVTLTNNYRTANGCGALRTDSRLVTAARAHSTDMVTKNFFAHAGSDGSTFVQREVRAGYTTGASAENIAWGYRSAQDVVTGWINSPGHRANILNCGSVAVGVGLAYKADGSPYWTQDFGRV